MIITNKIAIFSHSCKSLRKNVEFKETLVGAYFIVRNFRGKKVLWFFCKIAKLNSAKSQIFLPTAKLNSAKIKGFSNREIKFHDFLESKKAFNRQLQFQENTGWFTEMTIDNNRIYCLQ